MTCFPVSLIVTFPITSNILRFRRYWGGGGRGGGFLGSESENKDTFNRLILTLAPIMVWIIIGKMPNYMLLAVLPLFRDITSQSYHHSKRERVILVKYLPPEINQNEKNYFYP